MVYIDFQVFIGTNSYKLNFGMQVWVEQPRLVDEKIRAPIRKFDALLQKKKNYPYTISIKTSLSIL